MFATARHNCIVSFRQAWVENTPAEKISGSNGVDEVSVRSVSEIALLGVRDVALRRLSGIAPLSVRLVVLLLGLPSTLLSRFPNPNPNSAPSDIALIDQ